MPELPSGFDRADGLAGRLGTATPDGAVLADWAGQYGKPIDGLPIEEQPDSPTIERAEQATFTRHIRMPWEEALNRIQWLGRGVVQQDSFGNLTKILSATLQREKGGMAMVTIVSEGMNFDNPPDQFQIVPIELGVNIIKHPRYFYAFMGDYQGSPTEKANQMVIRVLQNYMENPSAAYRDALHLMLENSLGETAGVGPSPPVYTGEDPTGVGGFTGLVKGTDMAKRAALEIIQKFWRGEETPYLVGYQITWSTFHFMPQYLNPGGYVEDPIRDATPQLPDYFWSPTFPPDGRTIFDAIAAINPQCYSTTGLSSGAVNISWLRKADEYDYERTWFKVIRTWIGSAVGFWDTQLFTSGHRPQSPDDYFLAPAT
jgi:hypothetical protein